MLFADSPTIIDRHIEGCPYELFETSEVLVERSDNSKVMLYGECVERLFYIFGTQTVESWTKWYTLFWSSRFEREKKLGIKIIGYK